MCWPPAPQIAPCLLALLRAFACGTQSEALLALTVSIRSRVCLANGLPWRQHVAHVGLGLRIALADASIFGSDFFEGENVKKVLDASCGSGEQAIALAGLGLNVTACDPSGGLVKRCAENAAHFGVDKNVRAQQSDFLNLSKDFKGELGTFDAVITKGSSLPHLHTNNDLRQALTVCCVPALIAPRGFHFACTRTHGWPLAI